MQRYFDSIEKIPYDALFVALSKESLTFFTKDNYSILTPIGYVLISEEISLKLTNNRDNDLLLETVKEAETVHHRDYLILNIQRGMLLKESIYWFDYRDIYFEIIHSNRNKKIA